MILKGESQFGKKRGSVRASNSSAADAAEPSSFWSSLTKIFTLGCIETSHNNQRNE